MIYDKVKLIFKFNDTKQEWKSIPSNNDTADWLINNVFNNGQEYIYTNLSKNKQFAPYSICVYYQPANKQTLYVEGRLKYRTPNTTNWKVIHWQNHNIGCISLTCARICFACFNRAFHA